MAKISICISVRLTAFILLLSEMSYCMPSFDHGPFLSSASILMPRSFPMEIRGVYEGRKRRYIIERDEPSCTKECKEKPICLPTFGEVIKDCKCQKCGTGVPAIDGNRCDENCPEGQEKNDKGGCCPKGQVPKAKGDGCEVKQDQDDKKGSCPDDQVFDARHGWDPKPAEMKCQIDDEKSCQKPKVSETRPEGKETDPSYKVLCGEPERDESKRPKCDPKIQYVDVFIDSDGKAHETCKMTRKYNDRKLSKPTNPDIRARIKKKYNELKPEYDKKNKEREENLKKLKELQTQRDKDAKDMADKIKASNDIKKERQAKCATPIALLMGVAFNHAVNSKRDGEHPYDWTTYYFDEAFITSDDRLRDWPDEIDVEKISKDVDTEAFLKKWDEYIDDHRRIGHSCNFQGKRSIDRRCSQRRSLEEWDMNLMADRVPDTNSSLVIPKFPPHDSNTDHLEKRNPFAPLLALLTQFSGRLAMGLTARATVSIIPRVPRLEGLLAANARLFQNAPTNQGTKAGVEGMKNAMTSIRNSDWKGWLKCLQDGLPL